ncbi:NAD(+) diphosphatase [Lysinibacter sp. HNR]|uniref:NAD(+) diphosphatase n=1 Tax=Lysinibacter sp. HNR TaxID=3031408 RepID=UPI002434D682|nr:NAD(+) diphosphatase [Lysinibacter sp. HNR]WGD36381.1 NAD(+) diphosphatase [Lysinibacter sp. HNR]
MVKPHHSHPLFSLSQHNRDAATREDPQLLAGAHNHPDARFLVLSRGRVLIVASDMEPPAIKFLSASQLPSEGEDFYLGRVAGARGVRTIPVFVRALDGEDSPGLIFASARDVMKHLSSEHSDLLVQALAVARWHEDYRFSPTTGRVTVTDHGGWMRYDPESGEEFFPRIDPAVIVLVRDSNDRILLGSNVLWEVERYSLLAGFVEAGESLEDAVLREVFEESGIRVVNPRYRASQPWPFPRSLMLGFEATIAPDQDPNDAVPDGKEIAELRWVSRDDVRAIPATIKLPGVSSIARRLIDDWLAEA